MNRKANWLVTILLLAVPFLLTGCSLKGTTTTSSQQTLTIWRVKGSDQSEKAFEAIMAAFKKQNQTVTIDYQAIDPNSEDYEEKIVNALAAGKGPDIWEIRSDELARQKDKLVPCSLASCPNGARARAQFRKVYATSIGEEMFDSNQIYGMPLAIDPLVLYINTDQIGQLNPKVEKFPKTWEELAQLGNRLTVKADGTIYRAGLALGTGTNVDRSSQILELLMLQAGTQMVDPTGKTATFELSVKDPVSDEPVLAALAVTAFYAGFGLPGSPYQSWDTTQPYSTEAFANGKVTMMINYLSLLPQMKQLNPDLKFTVGPVPQFDLKKAPVEDVNLKTNDTTYTAKYRSLVVSKAPVTLTKKARETKQNLAWQFIVAATNPKLTAGFASASSLVPPEIPSGASNAALDPTTLTDPAAIINPHLKTWYRGVNPRAVDRIMKQFIVSVTEQNQSLIESLNQTASLVTQVLQ